MRYTLHEWQGHKGIPIYSIKNEKGEFVKRNDDEKVGTTKDIGFSLRFLDIEKALDYCDHLSFFYDENGVKNNLVKREVVE